MLRLPPRERHRSALLSVGLGVVMVWSGSALRDRQPSDSTTTTSVSAVAATSVVQVRPLDADGKLKDAYRVKESVTRARCDRGIQPLAGSPSVAVGGALLCTSDRLAVSWDPCWPETGRSRPSVICLSRPWRHDVTRLFITEELPVVPQGNRSYTWGVELASGLRCRVSIGAHDDVEDEVITYYCGDDDKLGLVLLTFDESEPLWTAHAARYVNGDFRRVKRIKDQTIVTAWY